MTIIETAYILTLDEFSLLKKQVKYASIKYPEIFEDNNIIRDASALMSLKSKGFVSLDQGKLTVSPILDRILIELCFSDAKMIDQDHAVVTGELMDLEISRYRLQNASYRIVTRMKGDIHEDIH